MMLTEIKTGSNFLRQYLAIQKTDFNTMALSEFILWLQQQIAHKQQDRIFIQRCKMRDLQKAHWPTLSQFKEQIRLAMEQWQNALNRIRLEELSNQKNNSTKAIAGLENALAKASDDIRRGQLSTKLETYRSSLASIQAEEQHLLAITPEKKALEDIQQQASLFQTQIGLTTLEIELQSMLHNMGQQSSKAGSNFEQNSYQYISQYIMPWVSPPKISEIKILSQVKLGCARAEIDYLIVAAYPHHSVEILAMIEAKRNPNDIAGGFAIRQENLAWFTGDASAYNPEQYRTHEFRDGHFSKTAYHQEHGREFAFDRHSFRKFIRHSSGYFLDRLFFITAERPLLGMNLDEHSRLMYRISSDIEFDINNHDYLAKILAWLKSSISPLQTKHILQLYLTAESLARQIIFIPKNQEK